MRVSPPSSVMERFWSRRPSIVLERCWSDRSSASARLRIDGVTGVVRFDGVAPEKRSVAGAFAAMARLMGMETGRPVVSVPRVSRDLRDRSDIYQGLHLSLYPQQHPSPLHALPRRRFRTPVPDGRRVAAFFSGGVDSYDLLVEHGELIDDLIFVRGFDVPVRDRVRNEEVLGAVRAGAEAAGKPLMVIDTDVRDFSDDYATWTWFVYGAMIAVAVLLGRTHRMVLCAASVADEHLPSDVVRGRTHGFGTDRAHLSIEGRVATRVEKIARVAEAGIARDTLRVCWQNVPGTVNCGSCHKCARTQIALAAVGAQHLISTLPEAIDTELVASHPAVSRSDRAYLTEARTAAAARGRDDLVTVLDRALGTNGAVS